MSKRSEEVGAKKRFQVPVALLAALGAWLVLVLLYTWLTYWRSPEYQAAQHLEEAKSLLKPDDGASAPPEKLTKAYGELLEAARLMPQERGLHRLLEHLNWRFEQRGFRLDPELRTRADAVAVVAERIESADKPYLVVGLKDEAWNPQAALEGPMHMLWWAGLGALGIVVLWAWKTMSFGAAAQERRRQRIEELEAEVRALAMQRDDERRVHPSETREEFPAVEPSDSVPPKKPLPPVEQRSKPYRDIFGKIQKHRERRSAEAEDENEDTVQEDGPTEYDQRRPDRRKKS